MTAAAPSGSCQTSVSQMSTQVARPRYGSRVAVGAARAAGAAARTMQARARIQPVLRATRETVCTLVAFDGVLRRPSLITNGDARRCKPAWHAGSHGPALHVSFVCLARGDA